MNKYVMRIGFTKKETSRPQRYSVNDMKAN